MTAAAAPGLRARAFAARLWAGIVAAFGFVAGVAPHVLHHAGPLAGAALLSGFGGKALFFALGLVLSAPLLVRLHRRFGTVAAPMLAVAGFAAVFAFSSLVIAPRIVGGEKAPSPLLEQPSQPAGHASHHSGGGK